MLIANKQVGSSLSYFLFKSNICGVPLNKTETSFQGKTL